jgi:hypothetical protein
MAYGKALSTYRRINKIKESSQKISEAQSIINQQRAKSISKARDLQARRQVVDAVSGAAQTAASYGMSRSDNLDPETATKISTAVGGAAEIGSSLIAPMSQEEFLGLSSEEYRHLDEQMRADPARGAISGYALQESLNEMRRRQDLDRAIKNLSEEERQGLTKDQLYDAAKEVEWEKGVGYDFSRLPEISKEIERQNLLRRGLIRENQPEQEDEWDLMNSIDFIRNQKRNDIASSTWGSKGAVRPIT